MNNIRYFLFTITLAMLNSQPLDAMTSNNWHQEKIERIECLYSHEDMINVFYQMENQSSRESQNKILLRFMFAEKYRYDIDWMPCYHFLNNINKWVNGWNFETTLFLSEKYLLYVLLIPKKFFKDPITRLYL